MINKVWINTLGVNTEIWIDEKGKGPVLICSLLGKEQAAGLLADKIEFYIGKTSSSEYLLRQKKFILSDETQKIYCQTHFIQKKYHSYGKGLYETYTDELVGYWENIKYLPLVLQALNEKINL